MGDTKKKLVQKKTGKSKKPKQRDFIKENVKKLKEIQSTRQRSEDEIRDVDAPIPYAERLKKIIMPLKKNQKKLNELQNKEKLYGPRFNIPENEQHSQSIVIQNFLKTASEYGNKQMLYNRNLQNSNYAGNIQNNIESGRKQMAIMTNIQDNNLENKEMQASVQTEYLQNTEETEEERLLRERERLLKEFSNTDLRKPIQSTFPKGYRNEGCQTSNKAESVSSKIVIRYPSNRFNSSKQLVKKEVCEKSFQTELNTADGSSINATKLNTKSNEDGLAPVNVEKLKQSFIPKRTQLTKPKTIRNLNNKITHTRVLEAGDTSGNANRVLNHMISTSDVNFEKLCKEIEEVQKMSPFARHRTGYMQKNLERKRELHSNSMKVDETRPTGSITLPEHKRKEYLAQITKRHKTILKELQSLPDDVKSPEARQHKVALTKVLEKMNSAMKLFSQNSLHVDLNPGPKPSKTNENN